MSIKKKVFVDSILFFYGRFLLIIVHYIYRAKRFLKQFFLKTNTKKFSVNFKMSSQPVLLCKFIEIYFLGFNVSCNCIISVIKCHNGLQCMLNVEKLKE